MPRTYQKDFILIGVIAGLTALLDFIGVIGIPAGFFSVSALYIGAAFFTAFAIWFGSRGLIAMYIGLLIGAVLAGTFTIFAFVFAWGNVIGAAVPMLVFRKLGFNAEIKKLKDGISYVVSTAVQSIISAAWVLTGFVAVGIMTKEAAIVASVGWILGGIIVSIVIGLPLLKYVTPVVKRMSLYRQKIL